MSTVVFQARDCDAAGRHWWRRSGKELGDLRAFIIVRPPWVLGGLSVPWWAVGMEGCTAHILQGENTTNPPPPPSQLPYFCAVLRCWVAVSPHPQSVSLEQLECCFVSVLFPCEKVLQITPRSNDSSVPRAGHASLNSACPGGSYVCNSGPLAPCRHVSQHRILVEGIQNCICPGSSQDLGPPTPHPQPVGRAGSEPLGGFLAASQAGLSM